MVSLKKNLVFLYQPKAKQALKDKYRRLLPSPKYFVRKNLIDKSRSHV